MHKAGIYMHFSVIYRCEAFSGFLNQVLTICLTASEPFTAHVANYGKLFEYVNPGLGSGNDLPTNERLVAYREIK